MARSRAAAARSPLVPAAKASRRLPAAARRQALIEAAAEHFAEHGFDASTRALARGMGVTQALLYRYFASKDALIEAVLEQNFTGRWDPSWTQLLADARQPLEARLSAFYSAYVGRARPSAVKLFVRAGLAGMGVPGRRGGALTAQIFAPVIAALRQSAGLPGFAERAMMRGERELAMMLHGSLMFIGIRRHVYRMPFPERIDDIVAAYVATFVAGAPEMLRRLHAAPGEGDLDALTVRQLLGRPSGRRSETSRR